MESSSVIIVGTCILEAITNIHPEVHIYFNPKINTTFMGQPGHLLGKHSLVSHTTIIPPKKKKNPAQS
ncbi:hypothetical protein EUGRSUZ_F02861 [Eucalyptus grandis]|uniref:Uncharacterized protein n=2 Tax=Eucalyptus grandis TaxID=71139 RepID=A0ACC3KIW3_EUCGR|nr:hypothetical protein EUGRSUZ_F02861 [Eucalyptus grandis]